MSAYSYVALGAMVYENPEKLMRLATGEESSTVATRVFAIEHLGNLPPSERVREIIDASLSHTSLVIRESARLAVAEMLERFEALEGLVPQRGGSCDDPSHRSTQKRGSEAASPTDPKNGGPHEEGKGT